MHTCMFLGALLALGHHGVDGARLGWGTAADKSTKDLLFLRDAEAVEYSLFGPWDRWADGQVSAQGTIDAVAKMKTMNETVLRQMVTSELVVMSPLSRSVGTAIITLATAAYLLGMDPQVLNQKEFVINAGLREKVLNSHDQNHNQPGKNPEETPKYIRDLVQVYSAKYWENYSALDGLAEKIVDSYNLERNRTDNWGRGWNDTKANYPGTSEKFLEEIGTFRDWLSGQSAERVLLVGHNSWAKWAFAAGLTPVCLDRDAEAPLSRLAFGGRMLRELPPVGFMSVTFNKGVFSSFKQLRTADEEASLPTCADKAQFGLFTSLEEATSAGLLPRNTILARMMLKVVNDKDQMVTFSAADNKSYLAWSEGWGRPRGFVELNDHLAYACDHNAWKVHVAYTNHENPESLKAIPGFMADMTPTTFHPFQLQARDSEESTQLCNLINIYSRFAKDTSFIAKILSEDGWDKESVYQRQSVNELEGVVHRSKWDEDYERLHASYPSPLWVLHRSTWEHGWFNDVEKYAAEGDTCTKVRWLQFTTVDYC